MVNLIPSFKLQAVCNAKDCTETQYAFTFDDTDDDPLWGADVINAIRYAYHHHADYYVYTQRLQTVRRDYDRH